MTDHETGLARNLDPDTSHAAARTMDATKLQGLVLWALQIRNPWYGMTATELSEYLRKPLNTISPRTRQLVDKGLIRDSGKRRATSSGRKAIVWEAVPTQAVQQELNLKSTMARKGSFQPFHSTQPEPVCL